MTSRATSLRPPVAEGAFRAAMGAIATPVSIVTTYDGEAHGTTVSAFMSLSLDPTLVLVSLQETSNLLDALRHSKRFGLNVLSHGQAHIAARFATRGVDRWEGVEWDMSNDVPHIAGSSSFVACSVYQVISAGDHLIITGMVDHAENTQLPGLVYQHRTFGGFAKA